MKISVTDAKGQLTELVKRAEAGEDVILTRFGHGVARLVPIAARPSAEQRARLLEEVRRSGGAKVIPGPPAARSQDFLYDDTGLPA